MSYWKITHLKGNTTKQKYFKPKDYSSKIAQLKSKNKENKEKIDTLLNYEAVLLNTLIHEFNKLREIYNKIGNGFKEQNDTMLFLLSLIIELEKKSNLTISNELLPESIRNLVQTIKDKIPEIANDLNKPLLERLGVDFFEEISKISSTTLGS